MIDFRFLTKIFSSFFFLLLLSSRFAFASWQLIYSGNYQGLATDAGEVIIPPVYQAIGWSDGSFGVEQNTIGFRENNRWGLISIKNKRLTNAEYEVMLPMSGYGVKAAVKGKFSNQLFYGILDEKGKTIIDFYYFSLEPFYWNDLILAAKYFDRNAHYGVLGRSGAVLVPFEFNEIIQVGEVIAANRRSKTKLFYADGRSVSELWLDSFEQLTSGNIKVQKDGKYGLFNESGRPIHEVRYKKVNDDGVLPFSHWKATKTSVKEYQFAIEGDSVHRDSEHEIWLVYTNDAQQLISESGAGLNENKSNRLVATKNHCLLMQNQFSLKWGLYKNDGTTLLEGVDSLVLADHYYFSLEGDRWSIFDYNGARIGAKKFESVLGEQAGKIGVANFGYWGWLDSLGNMVVKHKYDKMDFGLKSDQFVIKHIGSWGVADFDGNFVIDPIYDKINMVNGLYVTRKGHATKVFDASGILKYYTGNEVFVQDEVLLVRDSALVGAVLDNGEVIRPGYHSVRRVGNGYEFRLGKNVAFVTQKGDHLVDLSSDIEEVIDFTESYYLIKKDGAYGFMDTRGRLRIANRYSNAKAFSDGLAAVQLIGKWAFINKEEEIVVQPFYESVAPFAKGFAVVAADEKYGLIDKSGNEVLPLEWKNITRVSTGNYVVTDFNDRMGLLDDQGAVILAPMYDFVQDHDNGLIVVEKYGLQGVMNYEGFTIFPFEYKKVKVQGEYILYRED